MKLESKHIRGITALYFGFALVLFAHLSILTWQFWVIAVPVILGYNISDK